eukprot:6212517-Pleurochrysis_carterae.AAC.12
MKVWICRGMLVVLEPTLPQGICAKAALNCASQQDMQSPRDVLSWHPEKVNANPVCHSPVLLSHLQNDVGSPRRRMRGSQCWKQRAAFPPQKLLRRLCGPCRHAALKEARRGSARADHSTASRTSRQRSGRGAPDGALQ